MGEVRRSRCGTRGFGWQSGTCWRNASRAPRSPDRRQQRDYEQLTMSKSGNAVAILAQPPGLWRILTPAIVSDTGNSRTVASRARAAFVDLEELRSGPVLVARKVAGVDAVGERGAGIRLRRTARGCRALGCLAPRRGLGRNGCRSSQSAGSDCRAVEQSRCVAMAMKISASISNFAFGSLCSRAAESRRHLDSVVRGVRQRARHAGHPAGSVAGDRAGIGRGADLPLGHG